MTEFHEMKLSDKGRSYYFYVLDADAFLSFYATHPEARIDFTGRKVTVEFGRRDGRL